MEPTPDMISIGDAKKKLVDTSSHRVLTTLVQNVESTLQKDATRFKEQTYTEIHDIASRLKIYEDIYTVDAPVPPPTAQEIFNNYKRSQKDNANTKAPWSQLSKDEQAVFIAKADEAQTTYSEKLDLHEKSRQRKILTPHEVSQRLQSWTMMDKDSINKSTDELLQNCLRMLIKLTSDFKSQVDASCNKPEQGNPSENKVAASRSRRKRATPSNETRTTKTTRKGGESSTTTTSRRKRKQRDEEQPIDEEVLETGTVESLENSKTPPNSPAPALIPTEQTTRSTDSSVYNLVTQPHDASNVTTGDTSKAEERVSKKKKAAPKEKHGVKPYHRFANEYKKKYAGESVEPANVVWKNMSDEQKQPYVELSASANPPKSSSNVKKKAPRTKNKSSRSETRMEDTELPHVNHMGTTSAPSPSHPSNQPNLMIHPMNPGNPGNPVHPQFTMSHLMQSSQQQQPLQQQQQPLQQQQQEPQPQSKPRPNFMNAPISSATHMLSGGPMGSNSLPHLTGFGPVSSAACSPLSGSSGSSTHSTPHNITNFTYMVPSDDDEDQP